MSQASPQPVPAAQPTQAPQPAPIARLSVVKRVFGREPAAWAGLLAVSVKLLFAFVVHLNGDHQALANALVAALAGLFVAMVTHDGVSAAILGVAQALLALAVGYGLKWSPDQQAVVMSAASAVLAMFVRSQVTAPVPAAAMPHPGGTAAAASTTPGTAPTSASTGKATAASGTASAPAQQDTPSLPAQQDAQPDIAQNTSRNASQTSAQSPRTPPAAG
jgi:hypothetical protein